MAVPTTPTQNSNHWTAIVIRSDKRNRYLTYIYHQCKYSIQLKCRRKLLPLITEFVVILDHLGVIYSLRPQKSLWPPSTLSIQKNEQLVICFKKIICKHATNFKAHLPVNVSVINVWPVTCLLWYERFFLF